MIKLKTILFEQSQSVPETIEQIWDGIVLPYGVRDTVSNGVVRQIQTALVKTLEQMGKPTFKPDGSFGPTTANGIATVMGITLSNPKTLTIGPNTLTTLGFKQPESVTDEVLIVAAVLAGEAKITDETAIRSVGNAIINRSIAKNKTILQTVTGKEPGGAYTFSVWYDAPRGESLINRVKQFVKERNFKGSTSLPYWNNVIKIAKQVVSRTLKDNTNGSTHYFTGARPYWADTKKNPKYKVLASIGGHEFGITGTGWDTAPVKR